MVNEAIFREYDVRGIAGKDLSRDVAVSLGKAFGSFIRMMNPHAQWMTVGRDVRMSSETLSSGLQEGLIATGMNVYDLGVCPTPAQYFSLFHLPVDGGVMVTGSHNPPEYNGFKLSVKKTTIYGDDIQRLKQIFMSQEWMLSQVEGKIETYDIVQAYKNYIIDKFSYLNDVNLKTLTVVIDAGNGTAGIVVPEILRAAGCTVIPLYCEPDGRFPNHHPDPTVVEYIQDLIAETKRQAADIGFGFDGDADRIGVVDKNGNIIWGDQLLILLSRELLKQKPGAKIVGDVKCSQLLFDDIKRHGGTPVMWKTGHSLVKQKMREEGALLAGEFSGHIFIGDSYFGYDDAIYTAIRIVEILKKTGKDIHELLEDVPKMFSTPEIRIECPEERKNEAVRIIVAKFRNYQENGGSPCPFREINTLDGVRVIFEKGWALVRVSNTQPVIVMRIEADTEFLLNQYRSFVEQELNHAGVTIL